MKRQVSVFMWAVITVMISGCYTSGMSVRERGVKNYSHMIYSHSDVMLEQPGANEVLRGPITLAIVQLGEASAPQIMLDDLRNETLMVRRVFSIPAPEDVFIKSDQNENQSSDHAQRIQKMRFLAKDLGADYLFFFSGTVDHQMMSNAWTVLDWTIIGAHMFPGKTHMAEGKTSGALLNVHTGNVVLIAGSDAKLKKLKPSFLESIWEYDEELTPTGFSVIAELRDELVKKLTQNLVTQWTALARP